MRTACSVDGCNRPVTGWGLCRTHYMREYRAGNISRPTQEDRFWAKVMKTPECWPWLAGITTKGYGSFWDPATKRHVSAHRFAYELLVGAIPDGLTVDHRCHTEDESCRGGNGCPHRRCVNPSHLQLVTPKENTLLARTAPTAINARKTECIRGHALEGDNVIVDHRGYRQCRTCTRARGLAAYYARKGA